MGAIRIISGVLGGRKIVVPIVNTSQHLRPSTDRTRTTLFNWLRHLGLIEGTEVADLFCGSGILGIEALSNGAKSVTWVDSATDTVSALERTLQALNINKACPKVTTRTINDTVEEFCHQRPNAILFDGVFLDPPYAYYNNDSYTRLIETILPIIKSQGWMYLESGVALSSINIPSLTLLRQTKVAKSYLHLWQLS